MNNLTRFFRPMMTITGLACSGIICLALVYLVFSVVTSRTTIGHALSTMGLRDAARLVDRMDQERPDDIQRLGVEADHRSIYGWVVDCQGANSVYEFPSEIQLDFLIPSSRPVYVRGDAKSVKIPRHSERAIVALSRTLSSQRIALRDTADSAYWFWQVTSVVTITLGMFTTILVSMSSTEFGRGDGQIQRVVRILAIIFPALGTAAAAVIAFYGPQAAWSQASRTLASLTQLHGQMAIGVWKLQCTKAAGDDNEAKITIALDDWSRRYVDFQTVSTASGGLSLARDLSAFCSS